MTDEDVKRLGKYFTEGREYVEGLKPGDYFDGVWPEAERRGYARNSFEFKWFSAGAIAELPREVRTTKDHYITHPLEY